MEEKPKKRCREVRREKTYMDGDYYLYEIHCACGIKCGGWTLEGVEEAFEIHLKKVK